MFWLVPKLEVCAYLVNMNLSSLTILYPSSQTKRLPLREIFWEYPSKLTWIPSTKNMTSGSSSTRLSTYISMIIDTYYYSLLFNKLSLLMFLENLERERIRAYNEYLKEQLEKETKIKRQRESYQHKKQQINANGIVGRLDRDDVRRLNIRKNTSLLLQEQNSQMSTLKKVESGIHERPEVKKNPSINQEMGNNDVFRLEKLRKDLRDQYNIHEMQQKQKKRNDHSFKQKEENFNQKHLQRVREMDDESKRYYNYINRKHEQNMRLYDMHSQLTHENDQYKKYNEKFTDTKKDVLYHLWRNETEERKKANIQTQELLKKQMDEFNQKKSVEKNYIQKGDDIDKSIFRSVMRNDERDKERYREDLKMQMQELQHRKSRQKMEAKEKYIINGVYGGQHGRDRVHQIHYMDRKIGGDSRLNKSVNLEKEEENKIKSDYPKTDEFRQSRQLLNIDHSYKSLQSHKKPIIHVNYEQLKPTPEIEPLRYQNYEKRNHFFS